MPQITIPMYGVTNALLLSAFDNEVSSWAELRSEYRTSTLSWTEFLTQVGEIDQIQLVRKSESDHESSVVLRIGTPLTATAAAMVTVYHDQGDWQFVTGGVSVASADSVLAALLALVPVKPSGGTEAGIDVTFWMMHPQMGAVSRTRELPRLGWDECAVNYPPSVRETASELLSLTAPPVGGNLMVFHGPPGTGKTRFLQTLAGAWSPWCDTHFIVDADEMFNSALYLHTVALEGMASADRHRLIVIEDGDEFIANDGKARSGAAVARLLNLADGFIGQGLKVMVLVSTNVEKVEFSSPIVRPGRCGALIDFPPFTHEEASTWAASKDLILPEGTEDVTLAELYQLGLATTGHGLSESTAVLA